MTSINLNNDNECIMCFTTAPVESVDIEMLNSSTIAVTWEPPSPLPGWNISYYLIEITSLTTHAPSRTYMERTATGNEASIVIMDGDLFVGDGVELVTEVRAVLDVGVDGVGMLEGESAVRRKTLEPGVLVCVCVCVCMLVCRLCKCNSLVTFEKA